MFKHIGGIVEAKIKGRKPDAFETSKQQRKEVTP